MSILQRLPEAKRISDTEYSCSCPACKTGTDRFRIFTNKNKAWCRVCDWKGDELQFLRDFYNLNYFDACKELGKTPKVKNKAQETSQEKAWSPKAQELPSEEWQQGAFNVLSKAQDALTPQCNLGRFLKEQRGFTEETIRCNGLGLDLQYGNLLIPQWGNLQEEAPLVGIRIRKHAGGYFSLKGSHAKDALSLYGNRYSNLLVIVESALDAMLLAQETECAVLALHSTSTRPHALMLEQINQTETVLLSLDNDNAGVQASHWWSQNVPKVQRFPLPQGSGKDITECFLDGLSLQTWLECHSEFLQETGTIFTQ